MKQTEAETLTEFYLQQLDNIVTTLLQTWNHMSPKGQMLMIRSFQVRVADIRKLGAEETQKYQQIIQKLPEKMRAILLA